MIWILLGAGCAGSFSEEGLVDLDQEWSLGDRLAADLAGEERVLEGPGIDPFLDRVGELLRAQAAGEYASASRRWRLRVIADPAGDAFVLPGGRLYLGSGLVDRMESGDELLGLAAHLFAHGVERHPARILGRKYGAEALEDAARGRDPALVSAVREELTDGSPLYPASLEEAADRDAIAALYRAGFDPLALRDVYERLIEEADPGLPAAFVRSHAVDERRVEGVRRQTRSLPPKELEGSLPGFAAFRDAVRRAAAVP